MEDIEMDLKDNEILITFRPMNIAAIAKKEVKLSVDRYQKVGDFAQTLLNLMQMKKESPSLVNLMLSGKFLDHQKTFEEQNVQDGSKIIFTMKRKVQSTASPQKQPEMPVQKIPPKSEEPEQKTDNKVNSQNVVSFGLQSDGSVRPLLMESTTAELKQDSINSLLDYGYNYDLIIETLLHLRQDPKYNPVGEIQRALDLMDSKLKQQEDDQIRAAKQISNLETSSQITQNIEIPKQTNIQKLKHQAKLPQNVTINLDNSNYSQVFTWGNGLQGQLGDERYSNYQNRPILVKEIKNTVIQQIACGANHTVALSNEGKIYFWGQYVCPLKKNEPTKYGRVKTPRLLQNIAHEYFIDIKAGSSHSLALNDQGQVYSWGEGTSGQLGIDIKQNYFDPQRVHIDPKIKIKKISAGVAHSSALTQRGQLLLWGSNQGCQLGYPKELRESLSPIFFGGKIAVEGLKGEEEKKQEGKEEEKETGEKTLWDIGFNYQDVVCGSFQTLAFIDQSPYLLSWGDGDHIAKTYSDIFKFDKPQKYDVGGKNALILTEGGNLYKLNLENKSAQQINTGAEAEFSSSIDQLSCGSDFIMLLKTDNNIYSMGQNKCGQLGLGNFQAKDQPSLIEDLLNEDVKGIYAGNQHSCCLVQHSTYISAMVQEYKQSNQNGCSPNSQMVTIKCQGNQDLLAHRIIIDCYTTIETLQTLPKLDCQLLIELMYGTLSYQSIYSWLLPYLHSHDSNILISSFQSLTSWVQTHITDSTQQSLLSELLGSVQRRLNSLISSLQEVETNELATILSEHFRERAKLLLDLVSVQSDLRNEQRGQNCLKHISYFRGFNLAEARAQVARNQQMMSDEARRRMQEDRMDYGEEEDRSDEEL